MVYLTLELPRVTAWHENGNNTAVQLHSVPTNIHVCLHVKDSYYEGTTSVLRVSINIWFKYHSNPGNTVFRYIHVVHVNIKCLKYILT